MIGSCGTSAVMRRLTALALVVAACGAACEAMASQAVGVLPPRYLSVPQFQQCLSSQSKGSYDTLCRPATRPAACPTASWRALRRLSGSDKLPRCP